MFEREARPDDGPHRHTSPFPTHQRDPHAARAVADGRGGTIMTWRCEAARRDAEHWERVLGWLDTYLSPEGRS